MRPPPWYRSTALGVLTVAAVLGCARPAYAVCGSWTPVAGASVRGELEDVSGSSATNVWVVGGSLGRTLAEHWNGSSWRRLPTPNPGRHGDRLLSVVAITPNDAWAVGEFGQQGRGELLLHWNGTGWHRRLLPTGARKASFADVAATSPSDVWAVGQSRRLRARIVHYDGSGWSIVPDASPVTGVHALAGVAATSTSNAWAVGRVRNHGLAEHWDGHAWHLTSIAATGILVSPPRERPMRGRWASVRRLELRSTTGTARHGRPSRLPAPTISSRRWRQPHPPMPGWWERW